MQDSILHIKDKYKVLAFCTLVKRYRKTSFIYKDENKIELCKNLGISYTCYKKYLGICKRLGFVKETNGTLQLIGLVKIIKSLDCGINKYCYFSYICKEQDFKKMIDAISISKMYRNYKQQAYEAENNSNLLDGLKRNCPKRSKQLAKKARKAGYLSTDEFIKIFSTSINNNIITGKAQVSKITGFSTATSGRLLTKLAKTELVDRTMSSIFIAGKSHEKFDDLKKQFNVVIPRKFGFLCILGSKIKIKESIDFSCLTIDGSVSVTRTKSMAQKNH